GDGVGGDAVATELGRLHQGERDDAALGGGVGGLTDRAHETGAGRGVDDPALDGLARLGLVAPVGGGMAGGGEVALEVDLHGEVPLLLGGVGEHAVPHHPGVVDHHVDVAEGVDGGPHEVRTAVPGGDVVSVGDGLAAQVAD